MATATLESRLNTFYSALLDKPTSATPSAVVSLETLLDMGLALYEDCQNANLSHNANVPEFIRRSEEGGGFQSSKGRGSEFGSLLKMWIVQAKGGSTRGSPA
ncbi:hypothetical protein IWQ61_002842 [Dispira simplex]|nr:hypothetical protein IWQ61_002842 [Dispira simplex]